MVDIIYKKNKAPIKALSRGDFFIRDHFSCDTPDLYILLSDPTDTTLETYDAFNITAQCMYCFLDLQVIPVDVEIIVTTNYFN